MPLITASTTVIAPGQSIALDVGGSISQFNTAANFKEAWLNQLRMSGVDVEALTVETGGVIENILKMDLSAKPYRGQVTIRTLNQQKINSLIAIVSNAAERAGSYSNTVSVPSQGQAPQGNIGGDVLIDLVGSVGVAGAGIANAPQAILDVSKMIVLGLVVIVGLVAFGPNVKSLARAAR